MDEVVIFTLASAVLGAILGSFINALSFRFNTGRSILWARSTSLKASRSKCMHCGHTLSPLDLIPIFSYLFLGGRCRYCETRISPQYPLVELVAAALSFGIYLLYPWTPSVYIFWLLVWMTILFIIVYDMRHTIIPWPASFLLMALAVVSLFVSGTPSLLALAAGPLLALPLFLLSLFSGGRWMGWGDSGFELSLGWFLGLTQGLTALMLGVWSGAIVGIVLLGISKIVKRFTPTRASQVLGFGFTMSSEIPFAPFLAFGMALVYFFHVDFFSTLTILF